MLRIPHCLESQLIDGGKGMSLMRQPFYSPETLLLSFWYSYLLETDKPQGLVQTEGLGKLIKIIHLNRNKRTWNYISRSRSQHGLNYSLFEMHVL
jgi:hypothetical protein